LDDAGGTSNAAVSFGDAGGFTDTASSFGGAGVSSDAAGGFSDGASVGESAFATAAIAPPAAESDAFSAAANPFSSAAGTSESAAPGAFGAAAGAGAFGSVATDAASFGDASFPAAAPFGENTLRAAPAAEAAAVASEDFAKVTDGFGSSERSLGAAGGFGGSTTFGGSASFGDATCDSFGAVTPQSPSTAFAAPASDFSAPQAGDTPLSFGADPFASTFVSSAPAASDTTNAPPSVDAGVTTPMPSLSHQPSLDAALGSNMSVASLNSDMHMYPSSASAAPVTSFGGFDVTRNDVAGAGGTPSALLDDPFGFSEDASAAQPSVVVGKASADGTALLDNPFGGNEAVAVGADAALLDDPFGDNEGVAVGPGASFVPAAPPAAPPLAPPSAHVPFELAAPDAVAASLLDDPFGDSGGVGGGPGAALLHDPFGGSDGVAGGLGATFMPAAPPSAPPAAHVPFLAEPDVAAASALLDDPFGDNGGLAAGSGAALLDDPFGENKSFSAASGPSSLPAAPPSAPPQGNLDDLMGALGWE